MMILYPPAPAEGAPSILDLPPDDWTMQPKLDGVRVLWRDGRAWTRQGTALTEAKGAAVIARLLAGVDATLDGEWIKCVGAFWAFDLPEGEGDWDERQAQLRAIAEPAGIPVLAGYVAAFATHYERLKRLRRGTSLAHLGTESTQAVPARLVEGVVLKRRASLYPKQTRPGQPTRDWLKRRFAWDSSLKG